MSDEGRPWLSVLLATAAVLVAVDIAGAVSKPKARNGRLVFGCSGCLDDPGLFSVNPNGKRLKHLGRGSYPAISPEGKRIAYVRSSRRLIIARMNGKGLRKLGEGTFPSWSPDGKRIAT